MQTTKTDYEIKKDQLKVLSIAEGSYNSSILFALLKLKIFERIGDNGKTLNDLALSLDVQPDTLARLLNAGVVVELLETSDGITYKVSPACRSVLLPSAGEHYLGDWIRHLRTSVLRSLNSTKLSSSLGRLLIFQHTWVPTKSIHVNFRWRCITMQRSAERNWLDSSTQPDAPPCWIWGPAPERIAILSACAIQALSCIF